MAIYNVSGPFMTTRITRRQLLACTAVAPLAMTAAPAPAVKPGIDLFSLRSQNWTPFQHLDYCAAHGAKVVHFSEVRFIGGLDPANLRAVRQYAEKLGIEVEIGMKSICPTSKMFDPKEGTAEEQLTRMIAAAKIVGSRIVRAVLGQLGRPPSRTHRTPHREHRAGSAQRSRRRPWTPTSRSPSRITRAICRRAS